MSFVPHDLACAELVELVTDWLEDRLAPEARGRFELHLATCSGCAAHLRQVRDVIRAARRAAPELVPQQLEAELLRAFRGWHRGSTA